MPFLLLSYLNTNAQNNSAMLQKFTLRSSSEILKDIYLLKQREIDGEEIKQPLITVMRGNDLPISGFLIDFKNDKEQRGVVLEISGSNDVVFLDLFWISGISVHDVDRVAHLLIDLTASEVKESATRLELKNKIKKESEKLSQRISPINFNLADEDIPSTGQQLFLTALFISDLTMSLIEIAKTDLGKEHIKTGLRTINIKKGNALEVNLDQGTLTVFYDFNRSYTTTAARAVLIDKIYNSL